MLLGMFLYVCWSFAHPLSVKCLFKTFACCFRIQSSTFFLLVRRCSLHILDMSP